MTALCDEPTIKCIRSFGACLAFSHMGHPLYNLLSELEAARIHFSLARYRPDSVLVTLTLVGERVEVDVFEDGHMEASRFVGNEDIIGSQELVSQIIAHHAEPAT